jgi:hypothetical protein
MLVTGSRDALPSIPVLEVPYGMEPALFSARRHPERLALLLGSASRTYTPIGLWTADRLTRTWAARAAGGYSAAVRAVDVEMGHPGAFLLNHSYEWGCTSAALADPLHGGNTLLRTLDWPFDGLGRALVVNRWDGGCGPCLGVTWPGLVGVLTGLAPGRFAAAINQPPLPLPGWGKAAGWVAARVRVAGSSAPSPTHVLREAFDRCRTFAEAKALIEGAPLCLPAIFTLAGPGPGEAVVIERTRSEAFLPPVPVAANHWTGALAPEGRPRNASSLDRHAAMRGVAARRPDWALGWLLPPIVQPDTRVAVMANPSSGRLLVQGWEREGPVTAILEVG